MSSASPACSQSSYEQPTESGEPAAPTSLRSHSERTQRLVPASARAGLTRKRPISVRSTSQTRSAAQKLPRKTDTCVCFFSAGCFGETYMAWRKPTWVPLFESEPECTTAAIQCVVRKMPPKHDLPEPAQATSLRKLSSARTSCRLPAIIASSWRTSNLDYFLVPNFTSPNCCQRDWSQVNHGAETFVTSSVKEICHENLEYYPALPVEVVVAWFFEWEMFGWQF